MTDKPRVTMTSTELAIELLTTSQALDGGRPEAERLLQEIKNAHAHELAEKQRAFLRSKGTVWTGSIGQVIDHIDPEKQR